VPELPEVETVVRDLRPHLTGRSIAGARCCGQPLRRPWCAEWESLLRGRLIEGVGRRGKWIILDLAGDFHLVFHLGMTGQLTVANAFAALNTHTHLLFDLGGSGPALQLRFRDIRRFGSATLFDSSEALLESFHASGLGPEPLGVPECYWRERLARTSRCLKAILLDQRVVAGVGNIYADEVLFQAMLHPARPGRSLTAREARRLHGGILWVLHCAIERRGSTIRDYVGGSGQKGGYQEEFSVYGRTGNPCPRCRTPIERIRLAGRSTHFCPRCQKAAGANGKGRKKRSSLSAEP
jgi:formamidopyrimidine-DNA glycosylase